jgi:hypothetical protein
LNLLSNPLFTYLYFYWVTASVATCCSPISLMRSPNLSDQSEPVFHLFLVSYWLKLLLSTVPSGAGAVLRVLRMQLAPCHIPVAVGEIRQFLQNKITVLPTTLCHLEHLLLLLEDAHRRFGFSQGQLGLGSCQY